MLLARLTELVLFTVRLNRKAKYNLEKDLANKFSALRIDEHGSELRNNSAGLRFVPGAAKVSAKYVYASTTLAHSLLSAVGI